MSSKPRFVGEKVRLGDVCNVLNGFAFKSKQYVDSGIRVIRIANVQKGYLEDSSPCFYPVALEQSIEQYLLIENDLLLSLTGNVGRVALLEESFLPAALNQRVACLRIKDETRLSKRYLYHALNSSLFENKCIESANGIAQKNLSTTWLKDYGILIPSMAEQERIVMQLDLLQQKIADVNRQLSELDLLVKSRFVEMFEESDRYNGNVYRLADIGEIASGITKGRKARDKELFETPYLSTANVQAGRLDLSVIKTIDATMPEIEKFRLAEGDVLMTEGGDPDKVGRGAVAHNLPKNCIHQNHVFRVRLNRVILYPEYFEMFLQSPGCREYFFRASKQTTGIATINKTQLRNMQVLVPPIKAQEEFLAFAAQVDKSRFIAQQQIEKLQMLYDSLAQDYFGD